MTDQSSSSPGYWQQTRLTYSDGTTYLVKLDMPTIQRLENRDTQLLETIRANIESSKLTDPSSATCALASPSNNDPPSVTGDALASSNNNDPLSITGGALAFPNNDPLSVTGGALAMASSSTEENLPKFWGRRETAVLFDLQSTMESEFHSMRTHKVLWKKISESMNKKGYKTTPSQCENKFKSLTREYRNTVDHNSKSGNDKKSCPF